jgi:sugar phosphate isomerase/epimerase
MQSNKNRIAVCSWSLQPQTPADLVAGLKATGVQRVQLALDPLRDDPAAWGNTPALLAAEGITVISGMLGCVGEDYSTLESIRLTGGIVPDQTWSQNLQNMRATASLAAAMGLPLVTFHAGFVPHNPADASFAKLLARLREAADIFAGAGLKLGLETGQETADSLLMLLQEVKRPNLVVNFDPANMILYDKGDPIEALRVLSGKVAQVHIKDAVRTRQPGTWGTEVPAGDGEVNWQAFFATLHGFNFVGDCVIEREAGNHRVQDIRRARQMVESVLGAGTKPGSTAVNG